MGKRTSRPSICQRCLSLPLPKGYGRIGGWFVSDGDGYVHANPLVCEAIRKMVEEQNATAKLVDHLAGGDEVQSGE